MKHYVVLLFFLTNVSYLTGTILLIDFGCSAARYIQQHIEEACVECVVRDYTVTDAEIAAINPQGVLLSGSPFSVYNPGSPLIPQMVFDLNIPIFGICYGEQLLAHQLGGRVENMGYRERGPIELMVIDTCLLTQGIWDTGDVVLVWMSHEDRVIDLPPGFRTIASTESSTYAVIADDSRLYYGVQFHPEVPKNSWPQLITQFVLNIVGEQADPSLMHDRTQFDAATFFRTPLCDCCSAKE